MVARPSQLPPEGDKVPPEGDKLPPEGVLGGISTHQLLPEGVVRRLSKG
jgi:hypothetical protein